MMTASQLLAAHWDGTLPVDIDLIARRIGVEVRDLPLSGEDRTISGKIEHPPEAHPVVWINRSEAQVRQRFTLAHELGHHALGHLRGTRKLLRDPAANFSSAGTSLVEREANAFAASLLMPANVARFAVHEKKVLDITRLASGFNVSQAAMRFRLQNLGLLHG